jgi:DNA repair photolyase
VIQVTESRSILSRTSGFLAEAGFTHSLNPARNCLFGCSYCYVPTMRVQAGLKPEDWRNWGRHTTFKSNAAALLERELRASQVIYCSPLVDPYQPGAQRYGPAAELWRAMLHRPPKLLAIQTRGVEIVDDIGLLRELAGVTELRISFSLTTNREEVRRRYEPRCAPLEKRIEAMGRLRDAGLRVFATLAPILPGDPEVMIQAALTVTADPLIGDPLHVRATKPDGATTHEPAFRLARDHGEAEWLDAAFQARQVRTLQDLARACGSDLVTGPQGFALLSRLK